MTTNDTPGLTAAQRREQIARARTAGNDAVSIATRIIAKATAECAVSEPIGPPASEALAFALLDALATLAQQQATIAALERDLAASVERQQLLTHKVITCGVAATHPNANLTREMACYAEKWNSPQAEAVRKLRDRAEQAERALAAAQAERDSAISRADNLRTFWKDRADDAAADVEMWRAECAAAKESRDAACEERDAYRAQTDAAEAALQHAQAEAGLLREALASAVAVLDRESLYWRGQYYDAAKAIDVALTPAPPAPVEERRPKFNPFEFDALNADEE